jgi:O-methyltransferase
MPHPPSRAADDAALARMVDGHLISQLLHVAVELDLPARLGGGPRTADELADDVGVDAGPLRQVLRGLAAEQVLSEDGSGRFGLTPLGERLGTFAGAVTARGTLYYPAVGHLLDALRTGRVAFELAYGAPMFDYLAAPSDLAEVFHSSMADRARREANAVAAAFDYSNCRTVVDVGGGRGILLARLLDERPELVGVLADLPSALPGARAYLDAAGVGDRVRDEAIDFFVAVPGGGDVYVLSRVLHDWKDADALSILETCRADMPNTARLVVIDAIVPEVASDAPAAIRMDLYMLVLLGARERTEGDLRALLVTAGFRVDGVTPLDPLSGLAMISASPTAASP